MLARMRNNLHTTWRQVADTTTAALPLLSASEQTMSTWARAVQSYAAVPPAFQGFFEPILAAGQMFPYTVLVPASESFLLRRPERLVCDLGDAIAVLERDGSSFAARCYPLRAISHLEVRKVLLDACITISGLTEGGEPARSTLKANTVTDYLFTPILEKIRQPDCIPAGALHRPQLEQFRHWSRLNFKFMNYARGSLLEGECVVRAVLQPEIRESLVTILGRTFYRSLAPTQACILTDRELIFIREDIRQAGGRRYGGIWDFIPLDKISAVSLEAKGEGTLVLSVRLPGCAPLEYLFQASARQEVEELLEQYRLLAV